MGDQTGRTEGWTTNTTRATVCLSPRSVPAADAGAAATPVTALMTGGVYSEEVVEDDVDVEVEDVDVEVEEEHMLRGSIQSNSSAASSSPCAPPKPRIM